MKKSFILEIYKSANTVFTIQDIALIFEERNFERLKAKINYYIKKKVLRRVRRGIYVKPDYNPLELATKIYTPAYVSLETVLQQEGVIFQYYDTIFVVSYLSREIVVDNHRINFKKIKQSAFLNKSGIANRDTYAIATKERAFLDALYLYKDYYFDNLNVLDVKKIKQLLKIYRSKRLKEKIRKIFKNA